MKSEIISSNAVAVLINNYFERLRKDALDAIRTYAAHS